MGEQFELSAFTLFGGFAEVLTHAFRILAPSAAESLDGLAV
jgi:hypothetical protein